jgi:hypothetical protein
MGENRDSDHQKDREGRKEKEKGTVLLKSWVKGQAYAEGSANSAEGVRLSCSYKGQ